MARLCEPIVKICGLSDAVSATAAIDGGASAIGFLLAKSPRQVLPEDIATILSKLPTVRPPAVGVVVNESASVIEAIVEQSGIDIVQLSGDEAVQVLDEIEVAVWKTLRFDAGTQVDEAVRLIEPWLSHRRPVAAIHVDAAVAGLYGGSGTRADWTLAAQLAERYPVILAGGLDADNVAEAIATVRPIGVDVSSGVEVEGRKVIGRIQRFIHASRQAFLGRA